MFASLKNAVARLRAYEPVRSILYPCLVVFASAVAVDATVSPIVNTGVQFAVVGVALLLGIPAIEATRARVTPAGRVAEQILDVARDVQQRADGGVTATEAVEVAENFATRLGRNSPYVQAAFDRAREAASYFDRGDHRA